MKIKEGRNPTGPARWIQNKMLIGDQVGAQIKLHHFHQKDLPTFLWMISLSIHCKSYSGMSILLSPFPEVYCWNNLQ